MPPYANPMFYCELCQRQSYDAVSHEKHLVSYMHTHAKNKVDARNALAQYGSNNKKRKGAFVLDEGVKPKKQTFQAPAIGAAGSSGLGARFKKVGAAVNEQKNEPAGIDKSAVKGQQETTAVPPPPPPPPSMPNNAVPPPPPPPSDIPSPPAVLQSIERHGSDAASPLPIDPTASVSRPMTDNYDQATPPADSPLEHTVEEQYADEQDVSDTASLHSQADRVAKLIDPHQYLKDLGSKYGEVHRAGMKRKAWTAAAEQPLKEKYGKNWLEYYLEDKWVESSHYKSCMSSMQNGEDPPTVQKFDWESDFE